MEFFAILIFGIIPLRIDDTFQLNLLNITSSSNIKDFIVTNPTGGISVLIGSISVFIIYLYFFNVLRKTKYFSESSEVQEKYAGIFWSLLIIFIIASWLVLSIESENKSGTLFIDFALVFIGFINIVFSLPIPSILKNHFYNSNIANSKEPEGEDYNYKFIESFQKFKEWPAEWLRSDIILAISLMLFGIILVKNCNIVLFLTAEYSLLAALFWSNQLRLIPKHKTTIELKNFGNLGDNIKIPDVFILSESSEGYFIVLNDRNQISKIMKDSIFKLIPQK